MLYQFQWWPWNCKGSPEDLPLSCSPWHLWSQAWPLSRNGTHLLAFISPQEWGHLKPRQQADGFALGSFVISNCAVMWTSPFVPREALLCLFPCNLPERYILFLSGLPPGHWPFPSHSCLESNSAFPLSQLPLLWRHLFPWFIVMVHLSP